MMSLKILDIRKLHGYRNGESEHITVSPTQGAELTAIIVNYEHRGFANLRYLAYSLLTILPDDYTDDFILYNYKGHIMTTENVGKYIQKVPLFNGEGFNLVDDYMLLWDGDFLEIK